ncbi:hypothetical protein [Cohnella sp.]|uniref:hypothetical protein n=1 Tax=Cohnella sp. TaxID=1883426 RepID=UPI003563A61F
MTMECGKRGGAWRKLGRAGTVALAFALSGCAAQAVGHTGESGFVLSSDVKSELQAKKLPLIQGDPVELRDQVRFEEVLNVREGSMLFNRADGLYKAELERLDEPRKVSETRASEVSEDGRRSLYERDGRHYVSDLESGETWVLDGAEANSRWSFADPEGEYVIGGVPGIIGLIRPESGEAKWADLKKIFDTSKYGYSYGNPRYYGGYIYVDGSFADKDNAIYRFSPDGGEAELYLDFPGGKARDSIGEYRFLPGGELLFAGTYDRESGLFVYDPQTREVSSLVLGTTIDGLGVGVSYSLSPDGKKLLFHTRDENNDHVYQAELDGTQLANGRYILRDSLYASVSRLAYWNADSASYYLKYTPPGGTVESIIAYRF